jgi:hypothetical protein
MSKQGKGYLQNQNGNKTQIEVDDDIDNLRILLNHYGPFDYAARPQRYVSENFNGWTLEIWWMFIKSIFTRNQ